MKKTVLTFVCLLSVGAFAQEKKFKIEVTDTEFAVIYRAVYLNQVFPAKESNLLLESILQQYKEQTDNKKTDSTKNK